MLYLGHLNSKSWNLLLFVKANCFFPVLLARRKWNTYSPENLLLRGIKQELNVIRYHETLSRLLKIAHEF